MNTLDLLFNSMIVPTRNELNLKNKNQNKPCTQKPPGGRVPSRYERSYRVDGPVSEKLARGEVPPLLLKIGPF